MHTDLLETIYQIVLVTAPLMACLTCLLGSLILLGFPVLMFATLGRIIARIEKGQAPQAKARRLRSQAGQETRNME